MCGRYALTDLNALIKDNRFRLEAVPPNLSPRYNIAPSQSVPAILNQAPRALQLVRWGLIPSWAKDPTIGYRMINARAETLAAAAPRLAPAAALIPLGRVASELRPHLNDGQLGRLVRFAR